MRILRPSPGRAGRGGLVELLPPPGRPCRGRGGERPARIDRSAGRVRPRLPLHAVRRERRSLDGTSEASRPLRSRHRGRAPRRDAAHVPPIDGTVARNGLLRSRRSGIRSHRGSPGSGGGEDRHRPLRRLQHGSVRRCDGSSRLATGRDGRDVPARARPTGSVQRRSCVTPSSWSTEGCSTISPST